MCTVSDARFFEAVGKITGLTDYHLENEELANTFRDMRGRVTAGEMEIIAEAFTRIFYNGMAIGQRR